MLKNWEWSDTFLMLLAVAILLIVGVVGYGVFQDHSIRFYYLSDHGINGGKNGYCIDGYREWWTNDTGVFCSDDINKTITIVKEMNAELVHLHGASK